MGGKSKGMEVFGCRGTGECDHVGPLCSVALDAATGIFRFGHGAVGDGFVHDCAELFEFDG